MKIYNQLFNLNKKAIMVPIANFDPIDCDLIVKMKLLVQLPDDSIEPAIGYGIRFNPYKTYTEEICVLDPMIFRKEMISRYLINKYKMGRVK